MKKIFSFLVCLLCLAFTAGSFGCGGSGALSIKYYAEGSDLLPMLISGKETIGLLPEPAATTLEKRTQGEKTWYRLDLQELYDGETKAYPQAVLMIKSSVLVAFPSLADEISAKLDSSVSFAKTQTENAVAAVKSKFEATTLTAASLNDTVIDNCKIYWQSTADAKASVKKYIGDIREIDLSSANEVDDGFFYSETETAAASDISSLTFYAPDGAPALAISKFIADEENFGTGAEINYNVVKSDAIVMAMASRSGDIILMPVNGATKKYSDGANASDPYKLVAVVTHGNFYVMSTEKITAEELRGKRIGVPNMGKVPDWTLQSVLNKLDIKFEVVD